MVVVWLSVGCVCFVLSELPRAFPCPSIVYFFDPITSPSTFNSPDARRIHSCHCSPTTQGIFDGEFLSIISDALSCSCCARELNVRSGIVGDGTDELSEVTCPFSLDALKTLARNRCNCIEEKILVHLSVTEITKVWQDRFGLVKDLGLMEDGVFEWRLWGVVKRDFFVVDCVESCLSRRIKMSCVDQVVITSQIVVRLAPVHLLILLVT